MVDISLSRKWSFRLLFLALVAFIVFAHLIPLQTTPSNWAMPDLLISLCFAWVLRRPDYVPILLIATVMLTTDFLFMRPPGLMAALVVLGAEFLRARGHILRELQFSLEWGVVAGVITGVMVTNRVLLILVMSPRPPLGLSLFQLVVTLLAYPVVVAFSHYGLGIRKIVAGEVDAWGHRL
ncbi:membrane protein [Marinosulfonomonas sp. PRT-SC04]|nr:membrane protein [Marinosulfonomonas sp. PRT-SC04]